MSASGLAPTDRIGSTGVVKRIGLLILAAVAGVAVLPAAGCSSKRPTAAPPPSVSPAASDTTPPASPASPTPGVSASGPLEFTVDGIGPYQLDAKLAALQAAGALAEVKMGGETCPENTTARGTGVWQDVRLSFRKDGTLYIAINRSPSIPTPSGAWLGTSLAQLKTIYKAISGQELTHGASSAYLVTTLSGRGILFDLDAGKKVISMIAGDAEYLRASYTGGTDFC